MHIVIEGPDLKEVNFNPVQRSEPSHSIIIIYNSFLGIYVVVIILVNNTPRAISQCNNPITVKPVLSDHAWVPKKVVFEYRWSLNRGQNAW